MDTKHFKTKIIISLKFIDDKNVIKKYYIKKIHIRMSNNLNYLVNVTNIFVEIPITAYYYFCNLIIMKKKILL